MSPAVLNGPVREGLGLTSMKYLPPLRILVRVCLYDRFKNASKASFNYTILCAKSYGVNCKHAHLGWQHLRSQVRMKPSGNSSRLGEPSIAVRVTCQAYSVILRCESGKQTRHLPSLHVKRHFVSKLIWPGCLCCCDCAVRSLQAVESMH